MDRGRENKDVESANPSLEDFYSRRAAEYDEIYEKPERQESLAELKAHVESLLSGTDLLEVACGTGYWTAVLAKVARSIVATDITPDVLAVARSRGLPLDRVRFFLADAYALDEIRGEFTAGLAGFWWSHVLKERLCEFLDGFHRRLGSGRRVVHFDNLYVEGGSTPLSRTDAAGNTYQVRQLKDGSRFTVLKNFPSESELRARVSPIASEVTYAEFKYYWCLSYRTL